MLSKQKRKQKRKDGHCSMSNGDWSICTVCNGRMGFESVDDVGNPLWITCFACDGTGKVWLDDDESEYDEDGLYLPNPHNHDTDDDYWR